jgi:hypothetical protein
MPKAFTVAALSVEVRRFRPLLLRHERGARASTAAKRAASTCTRFLWARSILTDLRCLRGFVQDPTRYVREEQDATPFTVHYTTATCTALRSTDYAFRARRSDVTTCLACTFTDSSGVLPCSFQHAAPDCSGTFSTRRASGASACWASKPQFLSAPEWASSAGIYDTSSLLGASADITGIARHH